ncbi:MAG: GNAT family N-acetyltransferase, partial [Ferruginibacter sp.]|nr:GNAT family N-acetyltransferase [Ferruginibacter sp.]
PLSAALNNNVCMIVVFNNFNVQTSKYMPLIKTARLAKLKFFSKLLFVFAIFNIVSYTIKIADINDFKTDFAVRNLIKSAYNAVALFPEKFIASNINRGASRPSIFFVAEESDRIIGCNAFMANDFLLDGKGYIGYQSCWSVTDPLHQGKGIFSGLINEAKKILGADGATFIFGIANDKSNPIITKKLGFVETPAQVLRIPNIPFLKKIYFTNKALQNNNGACFINEKQLMEHKLIQYPSAIRKVEYNSSWLWGKLEYKKKYGIKWLVFYVGGVELSDEKDLKVLVSKIFELYKVSFVQFFSCKTNTVNRLMRGWRKPNMNGFIYFNLSMPDFKHFNCMLGAIDIF